MGLYLFNISWMAFNIYLALLPVIFSLFLMYARNKVIVWVAGVFWFLYLPNTIYIFTDLHHLVEQWSYVDTNGKFILIVQYTLLEVIGLSCYLLAFYPVEIILAKFQSIKRYHVHIIVALNLFIGLLMSLGKFQRVNSWDVFVNPPFLFMSTLQFLQTWELVALGILFGLFANFFYFLMRDTTKRFYTRLLID